jgi:hypothetical protein
MRPSSPSDSMQHGKEHGMDDTRFDAWTRRRFGLTTGGLFASLAGVAAVEDDAAAKRDRKKCKNGEKRCGKKKCVKGDCCPGKPCGELCECQRTVGGRTFCTALNIKVVCAQCDSNADCGEELRCVKTNGCGPNITASCALPCGFEI